MKVQSSILDGRRVTLYLTGDAAPAVYVNMYEETGAQVLEQCGALGCRAFNMVSVSGLNWNADLSPWPAEPIFDRDGGFTGGADAYVRWMENVLIPYSENIIGSPTSRIIAGYSMAGLFSLYAPYITELFDRAVSASGSVWYPGFAEHVKEHGFLKPPEAIYLSLGDRESRTKNPVFSRTEGLTRELGEIYASMGINSIFELNPGNHFRDAALRLAKGIYWILNN